MIDAHNEAMMRKAIAAASASRCTVSPRPWVGAVIEPGGHTGATQGRDGPHAEVVALAKAGEQARGATLWCTLEPCSHHGRTGPCADAVIDAGIARVVVGIEDPDPKVAGDGIARLRDAGIEVEIGVCADEVRAQLQPYLTHRETGRPYVVLKLASTLDGRTAAPDGSSQWITSPEARADAHRLRAESDAVLAGAGTVRSDDPSLTVRLPEVEALADFQQPVRVVLGSVPSGAKVHPCLEVKGDLGDILNDLGERGVLQVLVEGGAGVAGEFHRQGLVDRYVLYLAPALFGGNDGRPLLAGGSARTIADVWRGDIADVRRVGPDLRVDIVPRTPSGASLNQRGGIGG